MSKFKLHTKQAVTSTKRVISNGEQFVQAVSLLTIAVFSYTQLHAHKFDAPVQWIVTVALVVIGVRGTYELIKFLDKE